MAIIVLDRDGVINQHAVDSIKNINEWRPLPGSIEAMSALSCAGFQLVVATNQSGLAQGLFDLDDLEAIHAKMRTLVEDAGGEIAAIFYCPHGRDDDCRCRKPKAGLLDAIEAEFDTSLHGCYLIGDRLQDLQAGLEKGCKPVLVKTGYGELTLQQLVSEPNPQLMETAVFADLAEFSRFVLP